jgi:hypothetical protein
MQMSLRIRRNHIGRIWMLPLSSSVTRLAMSVMESSLSISVELRARGLLVGAAESREVLVILLLPICKT